MPAVYGQDPQSGTNNQNTSYATNMYVETMELGVSLVGATETVVTCGDSDSQSQPSTVDLRQLESSSCPEEKCDLSQPGTNLHTFNNYADHYEELKSPASVASECSINSHVAYAEVANENIIKEIESYITRDPHSVPVKQLRGVIPKMKMVTYLDHEEWQGKEKVKFLWENKPLDWPIDVHHSDPNNGIKIPGSNSKVKPKKEDLIPMFEHLRAKFLQMYKPELLISKAMDEDRAESTLIAEPKLPPISMTEVPVEDKMAPSGEPATPQPVPETGNWHQMNQLREMVEDQCRNLESQLDQQMIFHLQHVYNAVVMMPETYLCEPDQQTLYIEGCCEVLKLLCKINCGLVLATEFEQNCKTIIENYGQKEQMAVKKEVPLESLGHSYNQQVMVYNMQASVTPPNIVGQVVWDDMDTKGPICGSNAMLSSTGPAMKKFEKNDMGVIPFSTENLEDLIKSTNIKTRLVTNPDPDDENVYPLPEKMAKLAESTPQAPVPTQMEQIVQTQRQQSIELQQSLFMPHSMPIKQEKYDLSPMIQKYPTGSQQLVTPPPGTITDEDFKHLLEFFQDAGGQTSIGNFPASTGFAPGGLPGPPSVNQDYVTLPPGGEFMKLLGDNNSSRGSNESLNSFPFEDVLELETEILNNPGALMPERNQSVAVKPPRPKSDDLPAVLDSFNGGPDSMELE